LIVYSAGETSSLIGLSCGYRHHCLSIHSCTCSLLRALVASSDSDSVATPGLSVLWALMASVQFRSHSWASCRLIVAPNSVGSCYFIVAVEQCCSMSPCCLLFTLFEQHRRISTLFVIHSNSLLAVVHCLSFTRRWSIEQCGLVDCWFRIFGTLVVQSLLLAFTPVCCLVVDYPILDIAVRRRSSLGFGSLLLQLFVVLVP